MFSKNLSTFWGWFCRVKKSYMLCGATFWCRHIFDCSQIILFRHLLIFPNYSLSLSNDVFVLLRIECSYQVDAKTAVCWVINIFQTQTWTWTCCRCNPKCLKHMEVALLRGTIRLLSCFKTHPALSLTQDSLNWGSNGSCNRTCFLWEEKMARNIYRPQNPICPFILARFQSFILFLLFWLMNFGRRRGTCLAECWIFFL